jgi:GTPase SAR1 family protein
VVVGDGYAGKTSLLKQLSDEPYDLDEESNRGVRGIRWP